MTKRDRYILKQDILKCEKTSLELSQEYKVHRDTVLRFAKELGVVLPREQDGSKSKRIKELLDTREHITQEEIIEEVECSNALVSQVASNYGYVLKSVYVKK